MERPIISARASHPGFSSGFTLIELMIVVAIIGILAAIAIPKFSELIRKSKEGKTKGSLGAFKSALTLYYSEMEGMMYPNTTEADGSDLTDSPGDTFHSGGPFLTKYTQYMDEVKLGPGISHPDNSRVDAWSRINTSTPPDTGYWAYTSATGQIVVGCSHTDSRGTSVNTW